VAYRELYAAQLRQEKISQLKGLLTKKIISQFEFDECVEKINETLTSEREKRSGKVPSNGYSYDADQGAGAFDDDDFDFDVQVACTFCGTINTSASGSDKCVKCGKKVDFPEKTSKEQRAQISLKDFGDGNSYLTFVQGGNFSEEKCKPLRNPMCVTPYQDGEFSLDLAGSERGMDFATFEEFIMYAAECRFTLPSGKTIGWSVSRRFKQWRAFAHTLEGQGDAVSPFDAHTISLLPVFPKKGRFDNLKGVRSNKIVTMREEQLREWLSGLVKLAPEVGDMIEDDDSDDESESEDEADDADELDEAWEAVNDPETGEVYYYNKHTGIATWERPRKDSAPPEAPPKPPLAHGWKAMKDEDSGEVYYWHAATQTSTWDRPMDNAATKTYSADQFCQVPSINKFFEIRKNVNSYKKSMKHGGG